MSKKIVIIGGVAGGASAAARARRLSEDSEIVIFERGNYISFANCGLPYHISGDIQKREDLLIQTPQTMLARFNIKVCIKTLVTEIDIKNKEILVQDLVSHEKYTEKYDKLILSPGAEPFVPPIAGCHLKNIVTLRNISDMDKIIKTIDKGITNKIIIIGAGYIGLEMTEALVAQGKQVVLIELSDQIMNTVDQEMVKNVENHLLSKKVDLKLKNSVKKFEEAGKILKVKLADEEIIDVDMVLIAIGVKPENDLAIKAGLAVSPSGGIIVDETMKTSNDDIYAVGDAIEIKHFITNEKMLIPLAGPANRQGRIAADTIFDRNSKYNQTQGTAICKVFDYIIAMTGINEKSAQKHSLSYKKIYTHATDHTSYYPGATMLDLKIIFDSKNGKLLGAQVVGKAGVDKRIDVLATAIRAGMTVFDLEDLELAYAPPYGSAKDPVNMAGFIASNWLRGDVDMCYWEDVKTLSDNQKVLDVRTTGEIQHARIPGVIPIPVDSIRERLGELNKDIEYLITCRIGIRAYIAYRIMVQKGYKAKVITGGYLTYLGML